MHPADLIFFWAKANPDRPAIIQPDMVLSYRDFAGAIDAVSTRIDGFKLDRQAPVAVSIDHPARQLVVCYALLRSGYTAAMAGPGMMAFLQGNGIENVIYAGEAPMLSGGRSLQFHDNWLRRDNKLPLPWNPAQPSAAQHTPLIFFTSGTTGVPKKIVLPGEALLDWVTMLPIIGNADSERVMIIPPLSSAMGYNHTSLLFYAGRTACFARGTEPQLAMINNFGVDEIIGSPQQVLGLATFIENGARCQIDGLKTVRIGGGFTSPDLVRRVQTHLCRHVVTAYGATETGLVSVASYDAIAGVPNAVGFVIPGMEIEIVDDSDEPLATGEQGRIRFHSDYFAKVHAANNPAPASGKAWWYPGDLGRLTSDGILCVDGRADDVINCGGVKFSGIELDDAVRSFPGVKDGGVCGVRAGSGLEEVWVAIAADEMPDLVKLRASLESAFQYMVIGRIERLEQIPRNALGKLQRHALKEVLLARAQ